MKRYNSMITIIVYVHAPQDAVEAGKREISQTLMIQTQDSIYLNELKTLIGSRLKNKKAKLRLMWLTKDGETVNLDSQRVMSQYVDYEWCCMPWVLHAHEDLPKVQKSLALTDQSKALFDRYDTNADGGIDKAELGRMLKELDRETLQVSEGLVDKFVTSEFAKSDTDGDRKLTLQEFTVYVTDMTRWMRAELLEQTHHKNVFSALAARAIEMTSPAAAPTPATDLPAGFDRSVKTPKYDLRLEIPEGAEVNGTIALSTMAPTRVAHLFDSDKRSELRGHTSLPGLSPRPTAPFGWQAMARCPWLTAHRSPHRSQARLPCSAAVPSSHLPPTAIPSCHLPPTAAPRRACTSSHHKTSPRLAPRAGRVESLPSRLRCESTSSGRMA